MSWVPGVRGTALSLDGTTSFVSVPDAGALDVTTGLSVSAWVRPGVQATQYVVKKAAQGTTDGYELGLSSGGVPFLRFNHAASGDTFRVNGTSALPANGQAWVHLAGTYDGQRMRIYVNGVEQGSVAGPASIATNSLPLVIGAEPGGVRPFKGAIDEVRLYDRALSATEVATVAAGG